MTPQNNSNRFSSIVFDNVNQKTASWATGELRLISGSLVNHSYDHKGRRLWEDVSPDGQYSSRQMEYNHKNERILRTGNVARQYVYDEASHLLGEYSGNTAIVEYVWLGDRPVAALYPNNRVVYLITDHLNTPRRGVDAATQNVVWSWDSDAFGVKQPAVLNASVNPVELNLRFAGQYYDVTTGLHYNHHRYYYPKLGRYLEPDPIKLEGGINTYAYVGNDPVNGVDPSGLYAETLLDMALAAESISNAIDDPTWLNIGAAFLDSAAVVFPVPAGAGWTVRTMERSKSVSGDLAGSIRTINPNYNLIPGYSQNCTQCVIATDRRFAGDINATALPTSGPQPISNITDALGGAFENVSGMLEIGSILSKSGNGARGIVYGADNARGFGHVWNVRIDNGVVQFLDSQPGRKAGNGVKNFDDFTDFKFLLTSPGK